MRASPLVHGDEVLLPRARVRQGAAQRGATSTRLHAALVPPEQRNAAHLETRGLGVELVQAPRGRLKLSRVLHYAVYFTFVEIVKSGFTGPPPSERVPGEDAVPREQPGGRGRLGAPRGRQQRRERTQRIAAQRARGRRQA